MRRVVILDEAKSHQSILLNAFRSRPEFDVVAVCNNVADGAEMIRRLKPDLVTIDLRMPYIDGSSLLDMIRDVEGVCKIMVSDQAYQSVAFSTKMRAAGAAICIGRGELERDPAGFFDQVTKAARVGAQPPILAQTPGAALDIRGSSAVIGTKGAGFDLMVDELDRLRVIEAKSLSNPDRERQFDLITKYAAEVTTFPVSLLTFIDRSTQWVKSAYGIEIESTPREQAFCNYTIAQDQAFVVPDATADTRFSSNPLVLGAPGIRSYAGHPVVTRDGVRVGALCVIDSRVRTVSAPVLAGLAAMAGIVAEMIDVRPALAA